MNTVILVLLAALLQQAPPPAKNDPNGIWQSDSGTKFDLKLTDTSLKVQLVDGSNPVYLKYEVNLKNTAEVNTYEGSGYFTAKLQEKECRFETTWNMTVVQPELMVGYITHVVPDAVSCEAKERHDEFTQLKKVK